MAVAGPILLRPAPALAQCNAMELMPDGSWEFNPELCPGKPGQRPAPPKIWTAIAYSASNLRNAAVWHAASQDAARKAALAACGTVRPDCKVAISGYACVALAISLNRAWGTGYDFGYIGAGNMALSTCAAKGGTQCVITATPCADDKALNGKYTSIAG